MTSLDFTLSRTAGRDFAPGDEILVSSLDHDGGVAPWLELAHDRDLRRPAHRAAARHDARLRGSASASSSERTRVVAFAWASNAIGTVVDAARVCKLAHDAGALAWIDAVHYAAHEPIDVRAIDADVLICSPYKFCGPHLGMAYGRAEVLETWRPYKARPAPTTRSGAGSRPARCRTSCSPASTPRSTTWTSIGGFEAIVPYERVARRALPGSAPG